MAVAAYFLLCGVVGEGQIGVVCILAAFPFALGGFFRYNGMTFEHFITAFIQSELLYPKRLVFKSDNLYAKAMEHSTIREKAKEPEKPTRRKGPNAQPKTALESKLSTPYLAEPQRIQAIPQNGNMSGGIRQRPLPAASIDIKRINAAERLATQRTIVKKQAADSAPRVAVRPDSLAPEHAADAFPSQIISAEKGRLPRQRSSAVDAPMNPKEPQRLKPQDKRELLSNNLRHLTRDTESASHSTEIVAHSAVQTPNTSSYPMRPASAEKVTEAMPDTPVSVSEVPPAKHNTRIPAETSPVQRYGRPKAQMRQPANPATAPIRQKIKTDAPKIKSAAKTVKQPVRAMERAKAKAILAVRKSTAAVRTTARTAQISGRAAEGTVRELGAAISRALKAPLEGLRALASMIAAGGGIALVVVLVICLVALLLATPFGLFLAPEHSDSGSTIQSAITSLDGELSLVIEQIQENNPHDVLNMDNDGVAAMMENWNDVLAIYAVLITTDDTSPGDAATMTPEKLNILRGVCWDMNRISYDLETVEDVDSGEEETTLTITISTKNKDEIAAEYGFTGEQLELLDELTQPEYEGLFEALAGSDASLILSPAQMQKIMEQMGSASTPPAGRWS